MIPKIPEVSAAEKSINSLPFLYGHRVKKKTIGKSRWIGVT
jgi:hypothetical protein